MASSTGGESDVEIEKIENPDIKGETGRQLNSPKPPSRAGSVSIIRSKSPSRAGSVSASRPKSPTRSASPAPSITSDDSDSSSDTETTTITPQFESVVESGRKKIKMTLKTNKKMSRVDVGLWMSNSTVLGNDDDGARIPVHMGKSIKAKQNYTFTCDVSPKDGRYYSICLIQGHEILYSAVYCYNKSGDKFVFSGPMAVASSYPKHRINTSVIHIKAHEHRIPTEPKALSEHKAPVIPTPEVKPTEVRTEIAEAEMDDSAEIALIVIIGVLSIICSVVYMFFCLYGCITCCTQKSEPRTVFYGSECPHVAPSSCRRCRQ